MTVPPDDRGLLLGDGLFETILWRDGALVLFEAHADRLRRGCRTLGLPEPEGLEAAALRAVGDAGLAQARAAVRLTWSAGSGGRGLDRPARPQPRLIASAAPTPLPDGPAALVTVAVRRNEGSPASRLKTLAYLDNVLARREAAERGGAGAEALMLNNRGEIACAAAANLFWFEGDNLVTPALACGVLDGIERARVMVRARERGVEVAEAARGRGALEGARGIFLTNSLIGIRPVDRLDGAAVEPHPLMESLIS